MDAVGIVIVIFVLAGALVLWRHQVNKAALDREFEELLANPPPGLYGDWLRAQQRTMADPQVWECVRQTFAPIKIIPSAEAAQVVEMAIQDKGGDTPQATRHEENILGGYTVFCSPDDDFEFVLVEYGTYSLNLRMAIASDKVDPYDYSDTTRFVQDLINNPTMGASWLNVEEFRGDSSTDESGGHDWMVLHHDPLSKTLTFSG